MDARRNEAFEMFVCKPSIGLEKNQNKVDVTEQLVHGQCASGHLSLISTFQLMPSTRR